MDVQLARQQWEEGYRGIERSGRDHPGSDGLLREQVDLVTTALRGRVGQRFTLEELAAAYDGAFEWARDLLHESRPDGAPPPDTPVIVDAAFHFYARGASDYEP